MSVELKLPKNLIAQENIDRGTRSDIKYEQANSDNFTLPDIAISLTPIALFISWIVFFLVVRKTRNGVWIVFFLVVRKTRNGVDNKRIFTINSLHKVPCKNCKYYSSNHYLKCAVQPSIVMTEEAKNCSEYLPNKSKMSPKNIFDRNDRSE